MPNIYYLDGQFVPESEALLPATDLAVLRGYGVFDYLRTYGGRPFHLQAHLERLRHSANLIGLKLNHALPALTDIIEDALERSGYPEASIRIVATGGTSSDNIMPVEGESRLVVIITPPPVNPEAWYTHGVKVITHRADRFLPEAKTLNYIPAIIALQKAQQQGAIDALYVDARGHVLEGTTTNLFAFYGDTLVTPGEGILRGITRQATLKAAEEAFEVSIMPLTVEELLRADEVFLTSSNKELCPVRQVDDQVIGKGVPGPNTHALAQLFKALTVESAGV